MSPISKSISGLARRAARDERGAIAVIFVIALVPIMLIGGAALDYARAARAKAQLHTAVDAATLAAAAKLGGSYEERQSAAYGALKANLAASSLESVTATVTDTTSADGKGVVIEASGQLPTSLFSMVGVNAVEVAVRSEALAGGGPAAEIALVLDNTGSMINDMPGLKTAASNFVNTIFTNSSAGNVKMSVVPYVAAVNVGSNFPMAALELTGTGTHHAAMYRGRWNTGIPDCYAYADQPVVVSPPAPDPGPVIDTNPGTPIGKDKMSDARPDADAVPWSRVDRSRSFARALFGVSRAVAQSVVTANTIDPIQTTPYTISPPFVPATVTVQIPDGYSMATKCALANPGVVSNFDLLNRMPGARWKGCVEARPAPYDVTDDPPTADSSTHFVPYFAPDEIDQPAGSPQFANNYLSDRHASWANLSTTLGFLPLGGLSDIMKFDNVNVPTLVETPPDTKGPNYACPDPLLRLTSVKADILAKISSLGYWNGGGTISSEGIAWGWRTISPNAPFAQGAAYGSTKKYIVLMTDGMNSMIDNRPSGSSIVLSEYTAYSYLGQNVRVSDYPYTFAKAETFLNGRMMEVCANAKAKGVSIFTILFRETDPTITSLLSSCASSPSQALKASDAVSLNAAFANIASKVNTLRLSK